jgi:hypothetical protein
MSLSKFYGEFFLDEIMVTNQKGMSSLDPAVGSYLTLVPGTMAKLASM